MKTFYFTISLILSVITTQAQAIQWLDTLAYSGHTSVVSQVSDSLGFVYIMGVFSPWTTHDTVSSSGVFVSKYDSLGNLLWTDKKNNGSLSCRGMVSDKKGNCYALFLASGPATFGSYSLAPTGDWAMTLTKYSPVGAVVWAKKVDNAGPSGLCMDVNGQVYVYGGTGSTAVFDTYTVVSQNFIARYDTNGTCNFLLSTAQGINNASEDGLGNIYVTDWNGPSGPFLLKKYNSFGVLQWTRYSCQGAVQADSYGNCYLWGSFGGSITFGSTTLNNPYSNGAVQSFLTKIDANGNYVWAIAPQSPYYFRDIFLTDKDIYVTGYTGNDDPNGWIHDGFISKYDTSGSLIKDNIYIQNNNSTRVTVAAKGGIYLTGNSWSQGGPYVAFLTKVSDYSAAVGISQKDKNTAVFNIYPNPTGGIITIQSGTAPSLQQAQGGLSSANTDIKIKNLLGHLIYSKQIYTNGYGIDETVDLSKYPKGVYFVQVNTGAALEVRKVVLE